MQSSGRYAIFSEITHNITCGFKSSMMWDCHWVSGFWCFSGFWCLCLQGLRPWYHDPFKCQEPLTQLHSVMFRKAWILSNAAVRTQTSHAVTCAQQSTFQNVCTGESTAHLLWQCITENPHHQLQLSRTYTKGFLGCHYTPSCSVQSHWCSYALRSNYIFKTVILFGSYSGVTGG